METGSTSGEVVLYLKLVGQGRPCGGSNIRTNS